MEDFDPKTGCSPCFLGVKSYQYVCQYSVGARWMGHAAGSSVRLAESPFSQPCRVVFGVSLPTQHRQGVVIGSGDRALGCKARVQWCWRTVAPAPRVIAPQNRTHLTQSPRRSKRQLGRTPAGQLAFKVAQAGRRVRLRQAFSSSTTPPTTAAAPRQMQSSPRLSGSVLKIGLSIGT